LAARRLLKPVELRLGFSVLRTLDLQMSDDVPCRLRVGHHLFTFFRAGFLVLLRDRLSLPDFEELLGCFRSASILPAI
jgi:hypothetical protein